MTQPQFSDPDLVHIFSLTKMVVLWRQSIKHWKHGQAGALDGSWAGCALTHPASWDLAPQPKKNMLKFWGIASANLYRLHVA